MEKKTCNTLTEREVRASYITDYLQYTVDKSVYFFFFFFFGWLIRFSPFHHLLLALYVAGPLRHRLHPSWSGSHTTIHVAAKHRAFHLQPK